MNNITHVYKNFIKKLIKERIKSFTDTMIEAVLDCFNNTNSNYVSVVSSLQEAERELIRQILVTTFEEIDNKYKCSSARFKFYVINKSNVPRTITTLFGDITFNRTYYKSRIDGSLHFVLDEILSLPKYDKYDPLVKAYALIIILKLINLFPALLLVIKSLP